MIYFLRKLIWFSFQRGSKENTGTFGSFGPFSLWDCILQKCLPLFQALNIEYSHLQFSLELFYLNSTLNFGIPKVLVFQLEVYYKVNRLLTGLPAQQKGTTARWDSNKTSLLLVHILDTGSQFKCFRKISINIFFLWFSYFTILSNFCEKFSALAQLHDEVKFCLKIKALHFCTSIFLKLWNKTNLVFSIVLTCIFCLYLTREKKLQIHLYNINRVSMVQLLVKTLIQTHSWLLDV